MTLHTPALWSLGDLAAAAKGSLDGEADAPVRGVSIDTRSLAKDDLFVALKDARDGHEFVPAAFKAGAAAALVDQDYVWQEGDGALIRVDDPLKGLEGIARDARERTTAEAVIAVTGSVGKTGTKEMLRACLGRIGATHAPEKSFNNHWGVPLTLARMPAATRFGVFEIGMNHAGEITPLTYMVRPHAAIITSVEAVHIEHFPDGLEGIADAKAEIFLGLEAGGVAVIPADNAFAERLSAKALEASARVVTFGRADGADVRLVDAVIGAAGSDLTVDCLGRRVTYRMASPGAHYASNSLAVVAALASLGLDLEPAFAAFAAMQPPAGRGARTVLTVPGGTALLIDESYNANPASVTAALAAMATVPREDYPRRIAVFGDMLELGPEGPAMHTGLSVAIATHGVDLVFAAGPLMKQLHDRLPKHVQGGAEATSRKLEADVLGAVKSGDVIMVKGSLGSRMGPIVDALKRKFAT